VDDPPGFLAVTGFVRATLPPAPARVLEVGAGSGQLAGALTDAGYEVVAIDPASESPEVRATPLHELDEPSRSFDAAVAVLSLHHVEPLEESCRRLGELVRPRGPLVIDEFDIERFDERAARWLIDARGDTLAEEHRVPEALVGDLRRHLHGLGRIAAALEEWFVVGEPVRGPYLYRWNLPPGHRAHEEELIATGRLPATGARLVGRRSDR
jgi:SAM-dependent methyltransferase